MVRVIEEQQPMAYQMCSTLYCFEMQHRSGHKNGNADGLSRGPLQVTEQMAVITSSPSHQLRDMKQAVKSHVFTFNYHFVCMHYFVTY